MLTQTEQDERKLYLGASEVAAVCGLDAFSTPWDIWARKKGLIEDSAGEAAELGDLLEAPLLTRFAARNQVMVVKPTPVICPDLPWARASLDGLTDDRRNVQIKLVGAHMVYKWADGVPDYVQCQVQWEMMCAGLSRSVVVALLGGTDYREFEVSRDDDAISALREVCGAWWQRHIIGNAEPTPDGSENCTRALTARFVKGHGLQDGDAEIIELCRAYKAAQAEVKSAEQKEREIGNVLRLAIGDREGYTFPGGKVTWKSDRTGRPEWKAIAMELGATPELIAAHTTAPARKLLVSLKGAKE